jgi:hypothetical protein
LINIVIISLHLPGMPRLGKIFWVTDILGLGSLLASIFRTSYGENMILHFPHRLPEKFLPYSIPAPFFILLLYIPAAVGLIWEKFQESIMVSISITGKGKKFGSYIIVQIPNFYFHVFLDKLYQSQAYEEWKRVRAKIPRTRGLFGTIFTTLAGNMDSCSWHIYPCDLEFSVLIYAGNWQGCCLKLRLPETPIRLVLKPLDINLNFWPFFL